MVLNGVCSRSKASSLRNCKKRLAVGAARFVPITSPHADCSAVQYLSRLTIEARFGEGNQGTSSRNPSQMIFTFIPAQALEMKQALEQMQQSTLLYEIGNRGIQVMQPNPLHRCSRRSI
eukprot:gb/GECG01014767.1/.p1 GENE.gb/GECG01014767.1/~~gb/GECG01014767.1/.p1  ORF type:complete len:119 (+),score=7.34 gb/GECG01014767.1/:1-357(+)